MVKPSKIRGFFNWQVLLCAFFGSVLFLITNNIQNASAEGELAVQTAQYENMLTITLRGQKYFDNKIDRDHTYYRVDDPDGCPDKIYDISNYDDNTAKYRVIKKSGADCKKAELDIDIKIQNADSNTVPGLLWIDAYKIARVYQVNKNFTYDKKDEIYYQNESNDDGCVHTLTPIKQPKPTDALSIDYSSFNKATLIVREKKTTINSATGTLRDQSLADNYLHYPFYNKIKYDNTVEIPNSDISCLRSKPVTVYITNTEDSHNFKGTEPTNGDPSSDDSSATNNDQGGEDDKEEACQIQGPIGWILNPICDIAIQSTTELGEHIEDALRVTPLTQSTSSNTSGVFEAWKVFRDLANALLVIVFLIAIFAQILPIEIDAYTIKKIMPKLVVAVIAIQASYFICQMLVDLSNVAGGGVGALLEGVIVRLPEVASTGSESNPATLIFASVAGIGIASLFIGPVLLLLLGALMSLLTLIITIQTRQVILIFLAILSPLAILAWILPNTESVSEKWWKNYTKLLLMYPIIAFILGGAKLAYYVMAGALTTSPTTTDATSIQQIMISFIPVIAFLMVPATFKMSGSILSAVNGAVSNKLGGVKGKVGGSDLYKNFRTGQKEKALLKMSDRKGIMRMASKVRAGETLGGFGRVGKRQLDAKVKAARQSELGNIQAGWEESGFENADLGKIMDAYLSGQDSVEVKGQKIKVDERTGQAAIAYLGANGGDKEIADMSAKHIFNGGQEVKKGTRFNKRMDQSKGSAFDKINRGLILGGAKAKQARSNPQLMKKEGAFTDQATVDSIVGLKGPTGQVAAQIAFGDQGDPTKNAAQNAAATQASRQKNIDNILAITSDRDAARAIDAKTAVAYRDEAVAWLTAEEAAGRGVLLEDGSRALDHIQNSISDQGAVIADPDKVVKAQW